MRESRALDAVSIGVAVNADKEPALRIDAGPIHPGSVVRHGDGAIVAHATNWRLERIAATDRNLLRVAIYELMFQEDVPAQVAINEAVEIAKRYGSQDSPSFINGVLDAVQQSRQKQHSADSE